MPEFTTSGVELKRWPTRLKPTQSSLNLRASTSTFTAPFNRTAQTMELPGALYELNASYGPFRPDVTREVKAFFAGLRGGAGRFIFPAYPCRYPPPAMYASERVTIIPLTVDTANITVDTTYITADATQYPLESLFTVSSTPDNVTINGTLWLNSNQAPLGIASYISWDDASGWRHLHEVVGITHNLDTGASTLTVEPPMRALPTVSTPMHIYAPSGVFRLTDDGQGALNKTGSQVGFTVGAVQSLPLTLQVTP